MKQEYNIKIVLAILSLILAFCVFNNDVFARGYAQPKEADSSFLKSSKWPQSLQDFMRLELIYGDHKIDALEAKYLVNATFQSPGKTDANGIAGNIQPIAVIMTVLPTDANAIETCISMIQSKANYPNGQAKKLLEEDLVKNLSSVDSVKSLCVEIISKNVYEKSFMSFRPERCAASHSGEIWILSCLARFLDSPCGSLGMTA